jgi:hypothetical protein
MIKQYFGTKARLKTKAHCSNIYQPYGCSKPSFIAEKSANENHLQLPQQVC